MIVFIRFCSKLMFHILATVQLLPCIVGGGL